MQSFGEDDTFCSRGRGGKHHGGLLLRVRQDRKSTRLNSSHLVISYAVFCLKKKIARDREVILFNNASVSSSSGDVPSTFEQMGANGSALTLALGLNKADVLGVSTGGIVQQQ